MADLLDAHPQGMRRHGPTQIIHPLPEENTTDSDTWTIDKLLAEVRLVGRKPPPALLDRIRSLGDPAVPALIALATDPKEYEIAEDDEEDVTGWAPYAVIALLGELHPPEALDPLLSLMAWDDYGKFDWLGGALVGALARFGRPALAPLVSIMGNSPRGVQVRGDAAEALKVLARNHPELRDEIVTALTAQLDRNEPTGPDVEIVYGSIVSSLSELEARESIPSIIRAFEERRVEESFAPWEEVRRALDIPPDVASHLERQHPDSPPSAPGPGIRDAKLLFETIEALSGIQDLPPPPWRLRQPGNEPE